MNKNKSNRVLLTIIIALVLIGLIMVFSASWPYSLKTSGNPYKVFIKQLIFALIGTIMMFITSKLNYRFYKKYSFYIFIVCLVIGLLVYSPIGYTLNYAKRWIKISSFTFMPSDVVKFGAIVISARYISNNYKDIRSFKKGIVPMILIMAISGGIIFFQPDLSTTIALCATIFIMFLVSGMNMKYAGLLVGTGVLGIVLSIVKSNSTYSRSSRVTAVLNPLKHLKDEGWQLSQSLFAVSTGSFLGLGLGKSRQKFLYLSEAHNDFIFAIICEETGLLGAFIVISLYLMLIYQGMKIAFQTENIFGKLMAIGIVSLIGIQAFINIATVIGLSPPTGIVLPFISNGGSSLVIFMAMAGILLNISKDNNI